MNQQPEQKTNNKRKTYGYACCCTIGVIGCGMPVLMCILGFLMLTGFRNIFHTDYGENMETCPFLEAEKGSNFCYYDTFNNRWCEFTISEAEFLEWCKNRESPWIPVEINSLPTLPKEERGTRDLASGEYILNARREITLSIERYNRVRSEHEKCAGRYKECCIDPTGKTDDACFHMLDEGYYYERRYSSGRGIYIQYNREKQRCYVEFSDN